MNSSNRKLLVSSMVWESSSQIHESQASAVETLGYSHQFFHFDEPIPADTDIVLVTGPYGTILPLIHQLQDRGSNQRPTLAYWFEESLDMRRPGWLRLSLARLFSEMHRDGLDPGALPRLAGKLFPGLIENKGKRLGFLGDILWLKNHGLLDVFALCSTVYAQYLNSLGVPSILVPRGYHPSYGYLMDTERDIAVAWLGKERTRRRAYSISWLKREMEKRGHCMMVYDGVRNQFIFGEDRTKILNRTWFVVNFNFSGPTDELSLRYYLAAANGCVVLTEPNDNEYRFQPGVHLVEAPLENMPDQIQYFLDNPEEWRRLSNAMLSLMQTELTMENSVRPILTEAERIYRRRRSLV